ncbi:hypothetical protein QUB63_32110 [Microcoleus sp. ARI1-B5]|uniref:hypothetical protein n=1 Tax=unclassified Microcoleus TaxID=2642155 RepID=UPI002FD49E81
MNSKVLISPLLISSIAIGNLTLVLAAVSAVSIAPAAIQSANHMVPRICIDRHGNEYVCP